MSKIPQEKPFGAVFPREEYEERRRKVRKAMAARGIDLLYVSSPRNINYLTGFDIIWFYHASPTGLVVQTGSERVLFFDSYHDRMVTEFSYIDEAVFYATFPFKPRGPMLDTVIDTLKARRLLKGTVGLEKWAYSPSPAVLQAMEERLAESGARVVDGSWIVDTVALVKSPLEIACMRKAASIADTGMEAGRKALRPGMTEIEVMSEIHYAMGKAGGEEAALRTSVSTEGFRMPHKPSTRIKVKRGERVFADICGVYHRYHSNLCRFYSLGDPPKKVRDRMALLAQSLPYVMEAVKPGDPTTAIGEAIDRCTESLGLRGLVARGGYDVGISIPPDWVGPTRIVPGAFVEADFVPGMIMNYEVFSNDPQVPAIGFIDTLLMTEKGLEALGKTPREVLVTEA